MKRFVIEIEKSKANFFEDLIKNFDFVKSIKVENIVEPRIYPAADFEIRSGNQDTESYNEEHTSDINLSASANNNISIINERERNLKQIRDAMSAIDKIRENRHK